MQLTTLVDGLGFAEGLRWHANKLWFSDFITRKVQTVDCDGHLEQVAFVPGQPSGLGFAPDGAPRVVSMLDRKLLSFVPEQLSEVADLGGHAVGPCNDMTISSKGHAYIGSMGYELWYAPALPSTRSPLVHVSPAGDVAIAATGLCGPNGAGFLPGEKTLVVAETHARRLTAFDVDDDGGLSNRRLFADLGGIHPDGICVAPNGDIWVAGLRDSKFLLVREGGQILQTIPVPGRWAIACALGGSDGQRLFCATTTAKQNNDMRLGRSKSAIEFIDLNT